MSEFPGCQLLPCACAYLGIVAETHKRIGYNCFLDCNDITNAQSFYPFMHSYLFDKLFIDKLLKRLSDMFNMSSAMYLKSYLPPKRIVDQYKFDLKRETLSTVITKIVLAGEIRKSCGLCTGSTMTPTA
jgi:hypothetical protein